MSLISEEVIFETPGVIEKLTGENAGDKHSLLDAVQFVYGGEDDESDSGILVRGGRGMFYPTDPELVTKTDGTIEFSAFDGTYQIRKFNEEDSSLLTGYGITLTPQMMEEMMALDEQVGLDQSVEALTNEAGEVTAVVFDVAGMGTFFRTEGKWAPATAEESAKYDGATTTDIEIDRAKELVERYDAGDKITEAELADYAVKE
jgi:hypothetical protein